MAFDNEVSSPIYNLFQERTRPPVVSQIDFKFDLNTPYKVYTLGIKKSYGVVLSVKRCPPQTFAWRGEVVAGIGLFVQRWKW